MRKLTGFAVMTLVSVFVLINLNCDDVGTSISIDGEGLDVNNGGKPVDEAAGDSLSNGNIPKKHSLVGEWKEARSNNVVGKKVIFSEIFFSAWSYNYELENPIAYEFPKYLADGYMLNGDTLEITITYQIALSRYIANNGMGTNVSKHSIKFYSDDTVTIDGFFNNTNESVTLYREYNNGDPSVKTLRNTMWKLTSIGNTQTNSLREPEPQNCDGCYKLLFLSDTTFATFSSANDLSGTYLADYTSNIINITRFGGTKVGEVGDGVIWGFDTFKKINKFTLLSEELRLYYNNNANFLLFKSL